MTRTVSNAEDLIDSRDVIARIAELESERDYFTEQLVEDGTEPERALLKWIAANPDEAAELDALKSLANEAKGSAEDWQCWATLIRDSYFEEYARDLAEDLGAIDRNAAWPHSCIDWHQAAGELQQDYTEVNFDGVLYWVR